MWNSEAPLKLLSEMPAHLNIDNLREIQQIIDVDKYKHSEIFKRDLCGEYSPFCELCEKHIKYPCAVAYVKMKQSEGMELEIAATEEELSVEEEETAETLEAPKKYIRIAIARRKK